MNKFAVNAAIAASLSLVAVTPVAAQEVAVPYSDLDLTSPTGAKTLAQRVDAACERPDIRDLKSVSIWQQCKDAARNTAMEQLNSKGIAFDSTAFVAG